MKKFQSYDMDDALPVGATEEGMEHGDDILPPMEGRSPLTEEMQGISPGPRSLEEQKKKGGWQIKEKRQPYDWDLKGCETIEDSAEKEKYKKELEKKERQRQYYAKWYAKQKEKKEQEKAEKEKKAPKKQEKLTLEDLPAAMEKMEEGAKLKAADIIMKNAAKDLRGDKSPEELLGTLYKHYSYYYEAYKAVLGGLLGK